MNYFTFLFKSALFNFSRNKGRTFLTSLGILIGVMSVVLLTAAGLGLRKYIQQQFESIGTDTIRILPGTVIRNGQFRGGGGSLGSIRFDERDVLAIRRVTGVANVAPVFTKSANIVYGGKKQFGDVYASTDDIFVGINVKAQYGRLFEKSDVQKRAKVAVLGSNIAKNLFGDASNAVGNTVKAESQVFKVIGVAESKGGGFGGPSLDDYVYVPYRGAQVFNPDRKFSAIIVKVKKGFTVPFVKDEVSKALQRRYKEDDFSVFEPTEVLNALESIFATLNVALVAIAAISLVVGGIGIMNIMYVTVTEKIKEIGIRRALGARKSDILYQFLIESVILSLFGGILGLVLSELIILGVQQFFPAYIDLGSVIIALGISTLIGVVFGVFPAKTAADLVPIDAIRNE
ncbi:ABC transporter permease [Candidatus Microgenomates bacterium]|nr:ABC transporter permease [Candidatus Microgenomates bacterium]